MLFNIPAWVTHACTLCRAFEIVVTIIWKMICMQKQNKNICLHEGAMSRCYQLRWWFPMFSWTIILADNSLTSALLAAMGKKYLFSRAPSVISLHPLYHWKKKKIEMGTILKYNRPFFSLDLSGKNISSQTLMKKKQQSRTADPEHVPSSIICTQNFSYLSMQGAFTHHYLSGIKASRTSTCFYVTNGIPIPPTQSSWLAWPCFHLLYWKAGKGGQGGEGVCVHAWFGVFWGRTVGGCC